jgi:hypothetical protein
MPGPVHKRFRQRGVEFEHLLADLFRRAGWHVLRQPRPRSADLQADLVVNAGGRKYLIEFKSAAEGRRDRLIPLLSQAILQAQAAARQFPESVIPVAVVAAACIPDSVAERVMEFAVRHAPDIGLGLIDSEGFRAFVGHGLEALNAERRRSPRVQFSPRRQASVHLFSNLNQWMLKILLSANIPESLLSAPRGKFRNASQLAQAAGVSIMSAFRVVRELSKEGFLDEREGWLRLVRVEDLMQRWLAASQGNPREIPLRWIIRGNQDQLLLAVQSYVSRLDEKGERPRGGRKGRFLRASPRICLGLFAAAEALGFGFVRGVAPFLYLERLDAEVLRQLGLRVDDAERPADVFVRIPRNDQAIFRASVKRNGLPVSDILQVWLDVSNHPSRGKEQADQIWRRVLAPALLEGGK